MSPGGTRRLAVISDIHGNVPALEAVLVDLAVRSVDEVLVGGDLVGRGPQGSLVVRRIAELGWPCVKGNHEDYLLSFRHGRVPDHWLEADHWSASRWMAAELGPSEVAYIEALPHDVRSEVVPDLRLVHGTPRSNNEGIGPWTRDREVEEHVAGIEERYLVCAHTHRPLLRRSASGTVVNVGSVGLPFNGDTRAQYAILEVHGEDLSVEFHQVEYDLEAIFEIYETSGFLDAGGVTARLLRLELERAAPYLVPFLQWAEASGVEPDERHIEEFERFYRADEPLGAFFGRLRRLGATGPRA